MDFIWHFVSSPYRLKTVSLLFFICDGINEIAEGKKVMEQQSGRNEMQEVAHKVNNIK